MKSSQEYKSGLGQASVLPQELKGWNWGAFFLNWIWGIGNSTYIALLMFVPLVNLVMPFVLGAKGNEWAWQNRVWRDVNHFKRAQRNWAIVSFSLLFIVFPLMCIPLFSVMKGEAYNLSLNEIERNSQVIELIGQPIKPSFWVLGNVKISGSSGTAAFQYSISGSSGSADVFVYATKEMQRWHLEKVVVYHKEKDKKIFVFPGSDSP